MPPNGNRQQRRRKNQDQEDDRNDRHAKPVKERVLRAIVNGERVVFAGKIIVPSATFEPTPGSNRRSPDRPNLPPEECGADPTR